MHQFASSIQQANASIGKILRKRTARKTRFANSLLSADYERIRVDENNSDVHVHYQRDDN